MTTHKVWLYFTQYAWADVEADDYNTAQEMAWAWDKAGFPKDEFSLKYFHILDWGR